MSKKKKIGISLGVILIVLLGVGLYIAFGVVGIEGKRTYAESEIVNNNVNSQVTVIDENTKYQTMNGFGASACWMGQEIGGWDNGEELISYLYDDEKGIGLNIYRYNLGAGSENDETIIAPSRRTECFLNEDGTYDFTADADAQNALKIAKNFAGDDLRVTLFCNSAPVLMTKNSKGYCSPVKNSEEDYQTNLDSSQYEPFADYCYNSAEYFLDQGYRVTSVSPINEPQYDWRAWYNEDGSVSVNQEGCYYSKTEATELLNAMVDKFDNSRVDESGCKVAMFESGSIEGKGSSAAAYMDCILGKGPKYVFKNKKLRDYFDAVSMHSYWSSTDTKKQAAEYLADKYSNYDIVCSEYCQMTDDENTGVYDLISQSGGTNGMTIDYGVAMANVIMDDLTLINAVEWDWWLGWSYGVYTDGLVYINENDHHDVQLSKRLWCLGNFSRFIEEGAVRVACSSGVEGLDSVAFKNEDGSTAVVYVNSGSEPLTTDLKALGSKGFEVYTTDAQNDLALTQTVEANSQDTKVTVPAMSVVTVYSK